MTAEVPVQTLIVSNLSAIREVTIALLPKLAIAAGLVLVGWLLAKAAAFFIQKTAVGLEKLFSRMSSFARYTAVKRAERNTARVLSYIAFWLVFLFFIMLAIQSTGYTNLFPWVKRVANYIPSFVICAVIILLGYIISRIVRESIIDMTRFQHNLIVAHIVGGLIIFIAVLFGTQQLAVNIDFLIRLFNLTYGIILAGVALTISLSAYRVIADLILMKMLTQHLSIGQNIQVADFSGTVSAINTTCVKLTSKQDDGHDHVLIVPAKYLSEFPTRIHGH